jgi:hypothetical protein
MEVGSTPAMGDVADSHATGHWRPWANFNLLTFPSNPSIRIRSSPRQRDIDER